MRCSTITYHNARSRIKDYDIAEFIHSFFDADIASGTRIHYNCYLAIIMRTQAMQFLYASLIYNHPYGMHRPTLEKKEDIINRKLLLGIFYICAASMAAITVYALYVSIAEYMSSGRVVIGEVLVYTDFPVRGLAKLVTYLMIVSVVGWYCVTKLGGDKVKDISKPVKSILQLVVLAIAVVALYEFIYNSIIWNSLITADAVKGIIRLDNINVPYPNPSTPWNLVFATKMSLAAFLISAHGFYTMSRTKVHSEQQEI